MLTIFLQKKIYLVKVEIWSDKEFVRQTLGEDLIRQGYVRKTDELLTNRLVVGVRFVAGIHRDTFCIGVLENHDHVFGDLLILNTLFSDCRFLTLNQIFVRFDKSVRRVYVGLAFRT